MAPSTRVHTTLTVDAGTRVARLTLAREPVNTMDAALWRELLTALDECEAGFADAACPRALIISSGVARDVFTAGNDIGELHAPATSAARYAAFWVLQNTVLSRLYASPLATIAAVRGACPAGGCALALCCDARVQADTPAACMGLNEVALGIPVPEFWQALLGRVIGRGPAERLCLFARLVAPAEGMRLGLVDAVVPVADLDVAASKVAAAALAMPDGARVETKRRERAAFAADWVAFAPKEAVGAWDMLASPATVAALGRVLERLKKGARSKL